MCHLVVPLAKVPKSSVLGAQTPTRECICVQSHKGFKIQTITNQTPESQETGLEIIRFFFKVGPVYLPSDV